VIVRELLTRLGFKVDETGARRYERSMDRVRRHAATLQANLGGVIGMFGAALSIGGIIRWADAWTEAENKIKSAEFAAGTMARSMSELNKIANEARTPIEDIATLYSKMMRASSALGASELEVARVTMTVSKALQAGGASAAEASSAVRQLGQGLQAGALQGDELNSILENSAVISQAIADEFGVQVGQLKELGEQRLLTSDRVFKAILASSQQVDEQFAATTTTVSQSITVLTNRAKEWIATNDDAMKGSQRMVDAILFLSLHIDKIAMVIMALMIPALMSVVLWVTTTTAAFAGLALALLANPITWIIGALVLLGLAIQDVYKWVTGGKSLIGQWLGPWTDVLEKLKDRWREFADRVKGDWDSIKSTFTSATAWVSAKWNGFLLLLEDPWRLLWYTTLPGMVETFAPGLFDPLRTAFQSLIDWIKNLWGTAMDGIGSRVRGLADRVKSFIPGMGGGETKPEGFAGARASGGPVQAGKRFLVGEDGPEDFIPKRSGWILPHGLTEMLGAAYTPPQATMRQTSIDVGGITVNAEISVPKGTSEDQTQAILAGLERKMTDTIRRVVVSTLPSFPETV
jgi:tape measure domain-containing protein